MPVCPWYFWYLGLFGSKFADGSQKGGVNGASVEQEGAENFKDAAFVASELCFGAESGLLPGVWGMFWLCGRWMPESVQRTLNVSGHGHVANARVVFPLQG